MQRARGESVKNRDGMRLIPIEMTPAAKIRRNSEKIKKELLIDSDSEN